MPKKVLTDAFVSINGVDLSDQVASVSIPYSREIQDATTMGATHRQKVAGLLDWSLQLEFVQNFDSAKVNATLCPLMAATSATAILVRESATNSTSATNPEYQGNAWLESYQPVGGNVGETHMAPAVFQGTDTLTQATS